MKLLNSLTEEDIKELMKASKKGKVQQLLVPVGGCLWKVCPDVIVSCSVSVTYGWAKLKTKTTRFKLFKKVTNVKDLRTDR